MDNSTTNQKWYDKTWLVIVLCIIFFPIGLYALWKNQSISKGWKIGVTVLIALIVITQWGEDKNGNSKSTSNSNTENTKESAKGVGIGEILHTDYFDIIVNSVSLKDRVNTGNEFADKQPEQGNLYLIIDASFKNTDNESRMLMDGSVWINYNDKEYEFDKAETIMLEGWGTLLDQINPLTTMTTKIVYKIPEEIKGPAYWQPGRADSDQRIFLGNLE